MEGEAEVGPSFKEASNNLMREEGHPRPQRGKSWERQYPVPLSSASWGDQASREQGENHDEP